MEKSKSVSLPVPGTALRWFILILVSITMASNYYVYDAMSSIKSVMQAQLGFSSTQYGLIVGFYSFPNLIMAIIGGILLDKWGIRKTGFLFVTCCVLGAFLTAYGASDIFRHGGFGFGFFQAVIPEYSPELKMMILGRLLFGLGAETSIVVTNKIMVKWFKGKELASAFAINVTMARLGTALALILSPVLIEAKTGWTTAIWFAVILMGIGFLFFIIFMIYDKKYDRPREGSLLNADEEFHFQDIIDLIKNKSFIYVCLLCVTFYSAVFPFQSYCPDFLHNKFNVSVYWSGMLSSMIIWGTIIFTPLFGWYVDRKGKRASLMLLGSALLAITHLTLATTYLTPYVAMFILGIAFSLVPAAMWPSVALIVEEKKLGTAYGMMTSIQNIGLFLFPLLAGMILDNTNPGITPEMVEAGKATLNYTPTILMFAGLGLVGLLFAYLLRKNETGGRGFGLESVSAS